MVPARTPNSQGQQPEMAAVRQLAGQERTPNIQGQQPESAVVAAFAPRPVAAMVLVTNSSSRTMGAR